ncbi:hypothetical protein I4U23_027146 [Adineta vaga]|nr:hypothetical protein I4U23_027146 [Adineta vaga]
MDKMKTLQYEFPKLTINLYSDFKSLRFLFTDDVPVNLQEHLIQLLKPINEEFSNFIYSWEIFRKTNHSEIWFRAGFGQSADQANIAARYSRRMKMNTFQSYDETSFRIILQNEFQMVENIRQTLCHIFKDTLVLEGNTLHENVFDIIRRNIDSEQNISNVIKRHYGVSLISFETINILRIYVKLIDTFQPCLYIPKREFANMNAAKFGGFSADIIGLGSKNLKATAEALTKSDTIDEVFVHTRTAERTVTEQFVEQKRYFERILRKTIASDKFKLTYSGDDCVVIAAAPITDDEKEAILFELNNDQYAWKYRLAFISDGVKDCDNELDPSKLKNLTFGIDMRTREVNQGSVRLILVESHRESSRRNKRNI